MHLQVGELPENRRAEAFRLRHQVLCEALAELPPNPDAEERDAWDACSLHVHVTLEGRLVAYVRIILAGDAPFLMESLGYKLDTLPSALRAHVGEPSRIIVDPKLARDLRVVHDPFNQLVAAAYQLSVERGVVGWVFDTDALFVRGLRQRGWPLVQLGEPIEHHGVKRAPYFVKLSEVESTQFAPRARRARLTVNPEPRWSRPNMNPISQVSWPENRAAFEAVVRERLPVVFRRAAADWPCTQRWNVAYLRERLADKQVTATRAPSRQFRADPERGHYAPTDMHKMSFGEFLDRTCAVNAEAAEASYYLHRQSLEQHLPELCGDVVVPEYLQGASLLLTSLWMGPAGSVTPIHHDFTDNLFVQVQGRKRVILYEPDPEAAFYRLPFRAGQGRSSWHLSRVGSADNADLEAHPLFRQARAFEVVMEPGDILLIPNFYWHEVHSLDSPSISLSYWWDRRSLSETEAAIAKVTEFVAFYDQQPAVWRSLIDGILRSR